MEEIRKRAFFHPKKNMYNPKTRFTILGHLRWMQEQTSFAPSFLREASQLAVRAAPLGAALQQAHHAIGLEPNSRARARRQTRFSTEVLAQKAQNSFSAAGEWPF